MAAYGGWPLNRWPLKRGPAVVEKAYCSTTITEDESLLKQLFHSRLLDMR